jgi:hypothetical protein
VPVEIAKQSGDFRKNYGVIVGAILYMRSISAARPRLFWWQALMTSYRSSVGLLVAMKKSTTWLERYWRRRHR